jgi:hypothetical protein
MGISRVATPQPEVVTALRWRPMTGNHFGEYGYTGPSGIRIPTEALCRYCMESISGRITDEFLSYYYFVTFAQIIEYN